MKHNDDLFDESWLFTAIHYCENSHYYKQIEQRGLHRKMDGWITCDFTSFSTVFQIYQDDGRLIIKGCVQWNVYI